MGSPYWFKTIINKTFSQRFRLTKLTHFPILRHLIDYTLFDGDDIYILPGHQSIDVAESLALEGSYAIPSDIVDHFIEQAGFHFIMDFCICRDSAPCKSYPLDLGCIFLGEAAKAINPKFGRAVTAQEALAHARKCRDAGLIHLIGRNKLDTVWLQVKPGRKLMTICNCCPCCCLWKILPTLAPQIGDKVNRLPGVSVRVTERCVGCGLCTHEICFTNAISLKDQQAVIAPERCKGCGRCVTTCPQKAIELHIASRDYIHQTIEQLASLVDVR